MASRKRDQGPDCVTHRPRGRMTLVSPQNLELPSTKAAKAAKARTKAERERARFERHLAGVAETVARWPKWKRDVVREVARELRGLDALNRALDDQQRVNREILRHPLR